MKFVIMNYLKGSFQQTIPEGMKRYITRKHFYKNHSFFKATQILFITH